LGIGLKPIIGTRVMLSTPAQMKTSPAPMAMAPAAEWIACIEEPQKRLMVAPATEIGSSAMRSIRRATLRPCSPSGKAQPKRRSSMSLGSMPVLAISAFTTAAARSSGRTLVRSPLLAKWKGERT
jgi:hypothetical protein